MKTLIMVIMLVTALVMGCSEDSAVGPIEVSEPKIEDTIPKETKDSIIKEIEKIDTVITIDSAGNKDTIEVVIPDTIPKVDDTVIVDEPDTIVIDTNTNIDTTVIDTIPDDTVIVDEPDTTVIDTNTNVDGIGDLFLSDSSIRENATGYVGTINCDGDTEIIEYILDDSDNYEIINNSLHRINPIDRDSTADAEEVTIIAKDIHGNETEATFDIITENIIDEELKIYLHESTDENTPTIKLDNLTDSIDWSLNEDDVAKVFVARTSEVGYVKNLWRKNNQSIEINCLIVNVELNSNTDGEAHDNDLFEIQTFDNELKYYKLEMDNIAYLTETVNLAEVGYVGNTIADRDTFNGRNFKLKFKELKNEYDIIDLGRDARVEVKITMSNGKVIYTSFVVKNLNL